jgi:hypothetical protein
MACTSASATTKGRSATYRDRLTLGTGAVLTHNEAARLLPMADRDARSWLASAGLVVDLDGRSLVVWADVLAALRTRSGATAPSPPIASRLPRVPLP